MTQHPTKEQIAAARRWTFLPPDGSTISDADVAILGDAASKDAGYAFGDNEKLFDGALRILVAALASAEKNAEIGRLAIACEAACREYTEIGGDHEYEQWHDAHAALTNAVNEAMAAQRKEGE